MAEREPTRPDPEDVPDVVLEELLAAFSKQDAEAIDFDDPSIDRLLGLADSVKNVEAGDAEPADAEPADAKPAETKAAEEKAGDTDPDTTKPTDPTDALTSSNTVALAQSTDQDPRGASTVKPTGVPVVPAPVNPSRKVIVIGLAVFGIVSVICGIAPNEIWLIVARVVHGIGAALIFPVSIAVVSSTFTVRR